MYTQPPHAEDGLLTCTHDFRQGPLRLSKLRRLMLSKQNTTGVTFLSLQPFVNACQSKGKRYARVHIHYTDVCNSYEYIAGVGGCYRPNRS